MSDNKNRFFMHMRSQINSENNIYSVLIVIVGLSAAAGGIGGRSIFGFESPFWDFGLLPTLAGLIIGISHLNGPRRRFVIGFEACGILAIIAYVASCCRPARWSIVSALLPFQTGFWLMPEMKTSWAALNPWGMLADLIILMAIPLLSALGGGLLASVRITLRRSMIAVAVIAVMLGLATSYLRRVRHCDRMGAYHRSQIVSVLVGSVGADGKIRFKPTGMDPNKNPVSESQRRKDAWHEEMSQRYWQSARYPWVHVGEEPPPQ